MSAAVPHPRTHAEPTPREDRGGRRSVAAALLLGAAGAALVLLSGGRTWSEGTAADVAQASAVQHASGQDVTALPGALAIVGLAALVAVFAVRRAGRLVVAGLLALSGAGVVASAVTALSDTAALEEKAAKASGLTRAGVEGVTHTAWPWVAVAGGVLLLLAGLLALRHGRDWPAMSGRYERDGAPRPRPRTAPDPDRPEELWKALDRGEDPTGGPGR
ncbi:TIGR02234 family membrane protein [Streptomyces cinnamoneus]|uniref:TIGR02234 family membrane protein n=1 Tax=Streptomyces cinnamoneus TaxID=53446 RepID=A0A2G1XQD9_STRCJ|nr:TIGR02234 family membrane protein [Streptomyces cinnamoneus]PHQ53454.1 TIGR02234 family membrane protein [Streptomyces cinnamoneus]PPT12759.1 TIGR02234 family membrane protein [Streptomyces cinnamoneus]